MSNESNNSADLFPKSLAREMCDGFVRFGTIFHIPTLNLNRIPQKLSEDFLDEVEGDVFDKLKATWPELFDRYILDFEKVEHEIFVEAIKDLNEKQFLINIEVSEPEGIKFNAEGAFEGCSVSSSHYNYWVFANNFVEAAKIAISIGQERFEKAVSKSHQKMISGS